MPNPGKILPLLLISSLCVGTLANEGDVVIGKSKISIGYEWKLQSTNLYGSLWFVVVRKYTEEVMDSIFY